MYLALALVLVGACGRVNFDPLSDGGSSGSGSDGGGSGSGDPDGGMQNPQACMGGTPSCTSTAGSLSQAGVYQAGNTTVQLGNGMSGTCGGATGNEFTIQLVALQAGEYRFSTNGSTFDTVLYVRDACNGTEIVCADTPNATELVTVTLAQAESVIAVVDGAGECGVFQFEARRAN
jgi:hypothetical protein